MRAMADVLDHGDGAVRQGLFEELADGARRDQVVAALQNQGGCLQLRNIRAMVGREGHLGEVLRDVGIGAAEAVRQFDAQFRLVGRAHDRRRHGARPTQVVALERAQQRLDVLTLETADVVAIVDVGR